MDASPLKCLHLELRLEIYEFVLTASRPIKVIFAPKPTTHEGVGESTSDPDCALAWTCRQIRGECLKVFFKCNTFQIRLNNFVRSAGGKITLDVPRSIQLWYSQPWLRFHKGLHRTGVVAGGLRLWIGDFHAGFCSDFKMLKSLISVYTKMARVNGLYIRGEFVIEFTILEWPLPTQGLGSFDKADCTLDCRDIRMSLRRLSNVFAERAISSVGEIAMVRGKIQRWLMRQAEKY